MARSGALWLGRRKLLEDLSSTRFSSLVPSRHILGVFYSQWFRQNSLIVEMTSCSLALPHRCCRKQNIKMGVRH